MAKDPKPPKPPRLFVNRQRFSIAMVQKPPDEMDWELRMKHRVKNWPEVVEFEDTEDVRNLLTEMTLGWSDKKK